MGGSGLTGFISGGDSLTAVITALENTTRFRVISRPTVVAKNNKKAIIASGEEIAVPTQIQSALNNVNSTNGIVSNLRASRHKEVTLAVGSGPAH